MTDSFAQFVLGQLAPLDDISSRPMFGGLGVYSGDQFFGIIFDGRLYFRTDEASRIDYEKRGMQPFRPTPRQTLKNYYEMPAEILEQPEALVAWARRSLESAR